MTPILEMKQVTKRYPGTLAVDRVDFNVCAGEVHALMGENGAGKSSLMKMMSGSFNDYEGEIFIKGKKVKLHSPAIAKEQGIEMIHQELSNALPLSIAENMLAGNLPTKLNFFIDRRKTKEICRHYLQKVGLEKLDPFTTLDRLSPHEQQLVEIAKALSNNPKILIMDEPTSSLSRAEVQILFGIIDQLKKEGLGIVYISHHIPEIFRVSDRTTVMRDGKWVACKSMHELSPELLVELMIGKAVSKTQVTRLQQAGPIAWKVNKLTRFGFFHDVSFHIRRGEILGIGGLAGSGRSEIARCLCGLDPIDSGSMRYNDEVLSISTMKDAICQGIAYLSEDRKTEGLALEQESLFNAMSAVNVQEKIKTKPKERLDIYMKLAKDLNIYPADPKRLINQYSGGNQQKILLAKWMATNPKLLILDEPTRGVDIGAKQLIHEVIARLADEGTSVLLITSDLPELVELSDRVVILHKGHITKELTQDFTEDSILLAANGE